MTAAQIIDAFVDRITSGEEEMIEETHRRMGEASQSLDIVARPELAATAEASSRASLRVVMSALRDRSVPVAVPPEALVEARLCARLGVPVNDLLQTYRVTHEQTWELAIEAVERASATAEERAEALRTVARTLYAYLDLVSVELPEAYATAGRMAPDRLLASVRRVLEGSRDRIDGTAYDVRGTHVGVVAWGAEAGVMVDALRTAASMLVVAVGDETAWAWMPPVSSRPELPVTGAQLAIGTPGHGSDGFRRTHTEALRAQAVATRIGASLTYYDQVAVEWLALVDLAAARAFVEAELGPLAGGGVREERLRNTVAAFLATGQSRAAAAASLGVADRTVAYRLRGAEERLGRPVYARATELAIALRWAALLRRNLPESAE